MGRANHGCSLHTGRFRQIKVLTTVANAFSSLYSQVSGQPVQMIGESEPSEEPPPLKKTNSARNVAMILKKTLSKHNLQATGNGAETPVPAAVSSDPSVDNGSVSGVKGPAGNTQEHKSEHKQTKLLWKKESPCLATVTEEAQLSEHAGKGTPKSKTVHDLVNGGLDHKEVGPSALPEGPSALLEETLSKNEPTAATESNLDKDFLVQRPNPRIALLLTNTKDSFEMEEVQSIEGEASLGTHRAGSEQLLRMASQHSDSSGFAEDTSVDSCAASLKVQESSDSCDSENTVTSTACNLNILEIERLMGSKEVLITDVPSVLDAVEPDVLNEDEIKPQSGREEPSCALHQLSDSGDGASIQTLVDSVQTPDSGSSSESAVTTEVEATSSTDSAAEHDCAVDPGCATDSPDGSHSHSKVRGAPLGAQQKAMSLCKEQDAVPSAERLSGQQRFSLRRSSSLPTNLLSPCRVVSSIKIQIFPGAFKQCSPPTFTYSYTPEQEEEREDRGSDMEDNEDQNKQEARSATPTVSCVPQEPPLPPMPQQAEEQASRIPPYPLHIPPHLSASSSSLHSPRGDWPERALGDHSQPWSTCSVPNLHNLGSLRSFQSAPCSVPNLHRLGSPHGLQNAPWSIPSNSPFSFPHSVSCHNLHGAPCGMSYNWPHSAPCNTSHGSPYSSPYSASPNTPHSHLHSPTCSPPFSDPHRLPYSAPPYLYSCSPLATPPRPAHGPSSTEMQLRRVLHDIRSAVQNLAQCSLLSDGFSSSAAFSQQGSVMPLYETTLQELQDVQSSLSAFRTQMMDVELALVRQQSAVFHHLSNAERQEAQVLQQLRNAVRHELQELELQLEDRLLSLQEQLRTSHTTTPYRHHMGLHRVRSSDSLSSTSSLSAMEPVSEMLREHVGHEGWPGTTCSPASGLSSRSGSPGRAARPRGAARERGSHTPERHALSRPGVYQASISLTPTPPPRPGVVPTSTSAQCPAPEKTELGEQGARGTLVNPHLQQLIEQVKESIAEEVRQEILSEILAAVAPQRSTVSTREPIV
ncbi:sperm-specific antigen 2 [Arapaima gigas]